MILWFPCRARTLRVMLSDQEKRVCEYYLRGRQVVYQFRRKGLEFARQMFARAIVIDQSTQPLLRGRGLFLVPLHAF